MRNWMLRGAAALALGCGGPALASPVTVLSNSPTPGDSFTNSGPTNQGQAVGASGWYYNNTRNSGVVGINTNLPRSGNGSVFFSSPNGAGKADIEFLANGTGFGGNFFAAGSLGSFSQFSGMAYDWYRVGTSTNPAVQQPALRVLIDLDGNPLTPADRAGLVFETAYNGLPVSATTDSWVTSTIGAATNLWSFGALGFATGGYGVTLADWQANSLLANAIVVGFSAGVGSGWNGVFEGAVDNISWTIAGQTTTTNFEVRPQQAAVPAPAALGLFGLALAGLALSRRRG